MDWPAVSIPGLAQRATAATAMFGRRSGPRTDHGDGRAVREGLPPDRRRESPEQAVASGRSGERTCHVLPVHLGGSERRRSIQPHRLGGLHQRETGRSIVVLSIRLPSASSASFCVICVMPNRLARQHRTDHRCARQSDRDRCHCSYRTSAVHRAIAASHFTRVFVSDFTVAVPAAVAA